MHQLAAPLPSIFCIFIKSLNYKLSPLIFFIIVSIFPLKILHAKPTITLAVPEISAELVKNNKKSEYLHDILKEALKRTGYDLKVVLLPYDRSLKMVKKGLVDGELVRTSNIEPYYPELIRVPESILEIDIVIISHSPIDLSTGWDALSGQSVGWLLGMKVIEENIPKTAKLSGAKSIKQLLNMLIKNRVDYVVFMRAFGLDYLGDNKHGLIVSEQALSSVPNYTYLNKKHKQLVPKLADALRQMKQDGTFQRIIKKNRNDSNDT